MVYWSFLIGIGRTSRQRRRKANVLTCSAVSSSFHFSSGVFLSSFSPEVAMARTESRRDGVEFGDERLNAAIDDAERVDAG